MKADAIVYTSNTGYTAEYAKILGQKTGLPVYDLAKDSKRLENGVAIIYLGWLMAGQIKGYKKATKRFDVKAVCGVGMSLTDSTMENLRKMNNVPEHIPVFTLQGGFDLQKLKGIYKLMMTVMQRTVSKGLADKKDRTLDEDAMLDILTNGGSRVSEENLKSVLEWYQA